MAIPTVSPGEWWAARQDLLVKEKELTRARDQLSARRRELPMMVIDKEYAFEGPDGKVTLPEVFEGRRQLIVYHFMANVSGYSWCPVCSFWVDNIGHLAHMHARDTTLAVICPEPFGEIQAFRRRMGWTMPWYSCQGSPFYQDFHVTLDPADEPDAPGISAFIRDGDRVLYAYSTYRRGSDMLNGTYNYLDLTPLGRQEEGLEHPMLWLRHHDQYDS